MELIERKKIIFTFCLFVIAFSLVLAKAFKLQVLDRAALLERSKDQVVREVKVYPKRGSILDRHGEPLAINIQTYSVFIIPKNIKQLNKTLKKLAAFLPDSSYQDLKSKVKNRKKFTWIARKISLKDEAVENIKNLEGVYIDGVPRRFYPNNDLLSQTLGFVGIDNGGLAGIEYQFNDQLKGKPKVIKYIRDNKGRAIKYESKKVGDEAKDIHLTIDKDLQSVAEKYLKEAVIKHEAKMGGIGIMDAYTGEVLAMANYPSFDANKLSSEDSGFRKLSFVSDPFEPGSSFKTITVVSALDNNIARSDTNYYCEKGVYRVGGHNITEAGGKKDLEWLSVSDILKYSSNVGTTKIAFDLTYPKLKETMDKFGFGEKTGIELPAESRGIILRDDNVSPLSLSNLSFGQGLAVTGIQLLSSYASIANGGFKVKPTLIKKDLSLKKDLMDDRERIITAQTVKSVTQTLLEVVDDGTGGKAKIPYFKMAGKTSTAQKTNEQGQYTEHIPSFIGFPINVDDRFVILVYVDSPQGKYHYGNDVAGPVFRKVAQHILYKKKELKIDLENYDKDLARKNDNYLDEVKSTLASNRKIVAGIMPDLVGLDKRTVNMISKKLGINIIHRGMGIVVEQFPEKGSKISSSSDISIRYNPPAYE